MKNNTILIAIVVAIIAGGAGFLGGTKYQQNKVQNNFRQIGGQRTGGTALNGQQRQGNGNGQNRMGFRPVSGEITSADDKSITVKMPDGSSKIVILSEKTSINKADIATKTDLKVGEKVAVFGTDNTDGSVTAQSIQLNPIEQFRREITGTPTPKE